MSSQKTIKQIPDGINHHSLKSQCTIAAGEPTAEKEEEGTVVSMAGEDTAEKEEQEDTSDANQVSDAELPMSIAAIEEEMLSLAVAEHLQQVDDWVAEDAMEPMAEPLCDAD